MSELILTPLGTVSPYPKGNKNCPGYLVEYNNQKILLDCGNGSTSLMDFQKDLENLKVFITHYHPDHWGDLTALIQAAFVYKKHGYIRNDIGIYLPKTEPVTEERTFGGDNRDDWGHTEYFDRDISELLLLKELAQNAPIKFEYYKGYETLNIGDSGIKVSICETEHNVDAYAFKIATDTGTICYSGDTGFSNSIVRFAKDADLFICESTFLRGQERYENNHLYAYEAGIMAKKANVKKLLLTHFWPEIDKEKYVEEAKTEFENTEALEEGNRLVLRR